MAYSATVYRDWPDGGKAHSIPYAQHQANAKALSAPPPAGTYDPALDYEQGTADRGLLDTQNDSDTQYDQGTQDYNRTLADLLTQSNDVAHQYTVLGQQQDQAANHQGVTSAGLLGLSANARNANQATDQSKINTAKTTAAIQYGRTYGGYDGNGVTDPVTGQPIVGTLATNLARAGIEDNAYDTGIAAQKVQQAQAGGYVAPPAATIPILAASQNTAQQRAAAAAAAARARAAAQEAAARKAARH